LNLTDEQKKKISDVQSEFARRKQRELFTGGGDAQERFGKLRELNTERDNKAMTVLTAEQRKTQHAQGPAPSTFHSLASAAGDAGRTDFVTMAWKGGNEWNPALIVE